MTYGGVDDDDEQNWYEQDGDWYGNIPTHWMALPASPGEGREPEGEKLNSTTGILKLDGQKENR